MKSGRKFLLILAFFAMLYGCSPEASKILVAEFGDEQVTLNEFENAYAKNAGGYDEAKDDSLSKYKNFLDLYVNFRMKLADAHSRGFESDPGLNSELNEYKRKVGASFIIEKELVEPALKELYDKKKLEFRVSHIMLKADTAGSTFWKDFADTLIGRINNGASFDKLAMEYSQDQFSKASGGDIYYITAGQIIPEFEKAVFATEAGQIYPTPVKTNYGYHIIKVTEKKDRKYKIRASHILIDFMNDEGKADTAFALQKVQEVASKIKQGEDFAVLAQQYSKDKGTAEKGGDLGQFERRMMVKEFDEAAFNLNVGEVSDIIQTRFGYHIIKLTEVIDFPSFEDERKGLRALYDRLYYKTAYDQVISDLKTKYNFKAEKTAYDIIEADTSGVKFYEYGKSSLHEKLKDVVLFAIADENYLFDSLVSRGKADTRYRNKTIDSATVAAIEKDFIGDMLLARKSETLDKTNPEFRNLMDDYKNGIYIFKLQEDEVWNKIKVDSTMMVNYHEKNKEKFTSPDRVDYSEIYCRKDSVANSFYQALQNGADFDSLAKNYTERNGFKEKAGRFGLQEVGDDVLDQQAWALESEGDYSKPFGSGSGWSIVKLNKKVPAGLKTFEEARAEISGILQDSESKRLEREYTGMLKERYKPVIKYESLEKAFKEKK
ncbi:MAG: peptidylprolyl isomerase [Ignavibacteriales bacterium]|nr:peptidylprolyl isomerase [Ignavibacteriales bacterium]MCF8315779.1 peptidylprolyl isomerase [Ignavibacteriales bacterium]MCF8437239.1 peptidylprolyl isomerase [Ignavibacteriales bacterium]